MPTKFKAWKSARNSVTNGGRTAVQIGGGTASAFQTSCTGWGFLNSGESHQPLTPILVKSMPSFWQKVAYTPPTCITMCLPFVSRCFCRSIKVRGRWSTLNEQCPQTRSFLPVSSEIPASSASFSLSCGNVAQLQTQNKKIINLTQKRLKRYFFLS